VIFGLGTDIIETARIEKLIARGTPYLRTIFTPGEIDYCESKRRKSQHYAARFAVKEATLKALSTGWRRGAALCDVEVVNDTEGSPHVRVHGKVKELFERHGIQHTSISISHTDKNAIAVIILET
jgi:holo-[acyl-carrier protein] synthase